MVVIGGVGDDVFVNGNGVLYRIFGWLVLMIMVVFLFNNYLIYW